MTKAKVLALLAIMVVLLTLPAVVLAQAQPPRPAVFGGTATVDGVRPANGTTVTAWIDGSQVATTTTSGGGYALLIAQPPGESFGGKEITFMVGSATASHAVPPLTNFQGILTDGGGVPITTLTTVEFRIWDAAALGNELWMCAAGQMGNISDRSHR